MSDLTKVKTDIMVYTPTTGKYQKTSITNLSEDEELAGILVADIDGNGL